MKKRILSLVLIITMLSIFLSNNVFAEMQNNEQFIDLAWYHGAAIKNDGSLWVWGDDQNQLLHLNSITNTRIPNRIMEDVKSVSLSSACCAVIKNDNSLWMWGNHYYIGKPTGGYLFQTPIKIMDDIKSVSLSFTHAAVIKNDDSLWLWGGESKRTIRKRININFLYSYKDYGRR